jgi:low temperature requirement protein LtrA
VSHSAIQYKVHAMPIKPNHAKKVGWLELFFDLIFVAAVAQLGRPLSERYAPQALAQYSFMFVLIWWAWLGHTMYYTRFGTDDRLQRALMFIQIFAVAVMAANARMSLSSRDAAGFGAAYAVMRIVLVLQYLRAKSTSGAPRLAGFHALGFGIAALVWIAAAVSPVPLRFLLWFVAIVIDFTTPWLSARYADQVPPDEAHLPERFGLFTIILLGESVAGVMRGIESQESWTTAAATSAIFGLGLVFCYWWWYFDGASAASERPVRTKNQAVRFQVWSYAHLPLYLGIAVLGIGIEHIITSSPEGPLSSEHMWILAGTAVIVMSALTLIETTSERHTRSAQSHLAGYVLALAPLLLPIVRKHVPGYAVICFLLVLGGVQVGRCGGHEEVSKERANGRMAVVRSL